MIMPPFSNGRQIVQKGRSLIGIYLMKTIWSPVEAHFDQDGKNIPSRKHAYIILTLLNPTFI